MEIHHVGCNNHKLNLEVGRMIDADTRMQTSMDGIHDTMTSSKTGLKKRALLRNITDLSPALKSNEMI